MYGRVKNPKEYGSWTRAIKGWWKKFKHWLCKVGLCNFDKCKCDCHCEDKPEGRSKAYYPTAVKPGPKMPLPPLPKVIHDSPPREGGCNVPGCSNKSVGGLDTCYAHR